MNGRAQDPEDGLGRTLLRCGSARGMGCFGLPWGGVLGGVGSEGITCGVNDTMAVYDVHTHNGLDELRCLDGGKFLFLETMSDGREGWDVMTHSAMTYAGDVSDRLSEWKWEGIYFWELFQKCYFWGNLAGTFWNVLMACRRWDCMVWIHGSLEDLLDAADLQRWISALWLRMSGFALIGSILQLAAGERRMEGKMEWDTCLL